MWRVCAGFTMLREEKSGGHDHAAAYRDQLVLPVLAVLQALVSCLFQPLSLLASSSRVDPDLIAMYFLGPK